MRRFSVGSKQRDAGQRAAMRQCHAVLQAAVPSGNKRSHVPALDGLRGMAVLMVMLMHFSSLQRPLSVPGNIFHRFMSTGIIGVDLFFVLSGFLITGILVDSKNTRHFFRNFFARRILRTFPLYYGYLIVLLLIGIPFIASHTSWSNSPNLKVIADNQWFFWLYGSNVLFSMKGHFLTGFVDHFWSLAVEEHFYLVWPAVVFFFSPKRLLGICVSLVILAALFRTALVLSAHNPLAIYILTPSRMDSLAVGGLANLLNRSLDGSEAFLVSLRWILATGVMLIAGYVSLESMYPHLSVIYRIIGPTIVSVVFASLLLLAISTLSVNRFAGRPFENSILLWLGKYSYGLYVFHVPIWSIKNRLIPVESLSHYIDSPFILWTIDICMPMAATVMAALLSWNLIEKRFLKLKRYFL